MTVVAVWYRPKLGQIWAAADSRISGGDAVLTDHGPKIFPVPIVCHGQDPKSKRWAAFRRYSFGFAYAGSALAANATHALATACTQSLAAKDGNTRPITLAAVADLYRTIAEKQIRELAMRADPVEARRYFFEGAVFGHCIDTQRFAGFKIVPTMEGGAFSMASAEMVLQPGFCNLLGSGAEAFMELDRELASTHPEPGVMTTLREMVVRGLHPEVGGHFQVGICDRSGFRLCPVLNTAPGANQAEVSFIGWHVADAPPTWMAIRSAITQQGLTTSRSG